MSKLKEKIKKYINKFDFKIEHKNSWYKRQEHYVAEMPINELDLIKKIGDYSMSTPTNHWAIIQSIKYIKNENIDGDIIESGVFKGGNLILFKKMIDELSLNKKIYAYDPFEGMPNPGKYDKDLKDVDASSIYDKKKSEEISWNFSSLEEVKKNISKFKIDTNKDFFFIKGKVENTLRINSNLPNKISLLRLDTDFYNSTKIELEILYPKLVKGGVLIIDDYGHWKGSKKAVDEYFKLDTNFHWFHRIDYASRLLIKKF